VNTAANLFGWLNRRSKASLVVSGLSLVLLIGLVDFFTPVSISDMPFYLVPILMGTWFVGRRAGILFAVTATLVWSAVDFLQLVPKEEGLVPWWNAAARLGVFLVVVFLLDAIKTVNEQLESRIEKRTAELAAEIAERQRVEGLLRSNEEIFRQLTGAIHEVFWMTSPNKRQLIYVSPAYETIWGRTCDSLYASPASWLEAIHPEDRERFFSAAMTSRADGEYNYEYRIIRPDGSLRWIHDQAFPVRDASGEVCRIAGLAQDITERKEAEAELTTLGHAVESTSELICITDLQDRFIFVNQAFQRVHGYSEAEILGKTPEILHSPRNSPALLTEVLKQTRLGGWRGEVLDRRKDGTEFPVYLNTSLVKDRTGRVIGFMGVAQDITERKQVEEDLRWKTAFLEAQVNSSIDGILVVDKHGKKILQNRRLNELWKIPQHIADDPDDKTQVQWVASRTTDPEEFVKTVEYLYSHPEEISRDERELKDGTILDRYSSPVIGKGGEYYGRIWTFRDITERKQFVEALQRQQSELKVLFDLIPAMIWFKDTKNRILRLNKRAAEIAGKTVEEIEGKPTSEIHPQDATKFYADDLEVIRSGLPKLGIVETMRNSEGKEFWAQTDKVPYRDKAGDVIGVVVFAQDITERKRAEESLRLLGSAVQQSKESIVITDAEVDLPGPRILFVNPAFTKMTGYTAAEVLGKTPRILQGPRSDRTVLRTLRQSLLRSEPFLGETINYRKDGTEFHLEWQVTPIRDASGFTTHFVAIQRDITERKLAEAKMTTLAHAVESTSELICITDLRDRFTFVNRAFQQIYGYAEHEVLGKTPEILFSPKNPPRLVREILEQTRTGGWRGEVLDRRKDGTEFPISLSTSRIVDESGAVIGLMGVARDITERTRDQEALRESEQRFRTAFRAAPVAMSIVSPDGCFLQVNRVFCEMLGYTEKELFGKTVREITYPADLDSTTSYMDRLMRRQGGSSTIEKRYLHKLGYQVWGRTTSSLIRDKTGHPLYLIAHIQDFTERRRLEREILEISDREQGRIGQDLHDGLCQQLVSTAFACNLLGQKLTTIAPSEAGTARQIAGWLDEAISQSRALARGLYPVKLETEGLASALQELAEYVNGRFGIACVLENVETALSVDHAVATHLYRIAQEAVTNAVKHSKASRILIKLAGKKGNVSVCIQDDGVGISDPIPYGMGLRIMQYRARMIGGSLKIEHGPNGGTVVVCLFHQEELETEGSDGA